MSQPRFDHRLDNLAGQRVWKKLFSPEHVRIDPDNHRVIYTHHTPDMDREQMARRMDRKVIKIEAAFGSERQSILVKRNQDLIVQDLMEEVQRTLKIPLEEQVIFHKGTNICDFPQDLLENFGVENNHAIRVTRDPQLPNRSPRNFQKPQQQQPQFIQQPQQFQQQPMPIANNFQPAQHYNNPNTYARPNVGLDPISYLKEISPQRVPDPTPYQVQVYNQSIVNNQSQAKPSGVNDVLKLYVSHGSEREYILINGKKPLMILDLKMQLSRQFKIAPDQQCIVFKGYNLHEYLDDAPLEAFGLENNSPIALWPKGSNNKQDLRLPRGATPPPMIGDLSPRAFHPPPGSFRWNGSNEPPTEVLKMEIQHGSDRHQIILRGQNKTLTVLDLQNELEKITAVPVKDQRLFFKSQELHFTPFKTLKECGLENNQVLKLVGEPSKLRYSNYFGKLVPNQNPNMIPPNNMNNPNQFQMQNSQQNPAFYQQPQPYQQSF